MASVLIIDDHESTRATYSTILRLSGFDIALAEDGKAGIELARARDFDVAVVDRRLPDMNGMEVARVLKLNHPLSRIVLVTAFPTIESSFEAAVIGADGYVDGPLFGDEIVEVVSQAITGPFPVHHPNDSRCQALDHKCATKPPSAIDPRVRTAVAMIDANLAKSWTVPELARNVDLSDSRFRHLFSAQVGVSVTQFRLDRRLRVGACLLRRTFEDIRQIAQGLGFTARGFRSAFVARFGVNPSEYRSTYRRGTQRT